MKILLKTVTNVEILNIDEWNIKERPYFNESDYE